VKLGVRLAQLFLSQCQPVVQRMLQRVLSVKCHKFIFHNAVCKNDHDIEIKAELSVAVFLLLYREFYVTENLLSLLLWAQGQHGNKILFYLNISDNYGKYMNILYKISILYFKE
jgi:hypothetical protein